MNCDELKKTVLRVAKLNKIALKGSAAHTARKYISENVNTEKTAQNAVLIGSSNIKDDVMNYIYKNRTDKKVIRKDAVYAEELVLSASPEFFQDLDITKKWAAKQIDFLKKEYGANCVNAVLHLDESTPHIHAFVVPIKDGKLSHKNWNNDRGGKFSYTRLQDRYEAFNKEFFDLTRTKKTAQSTTATHKELKQYYNTVKKLKEYTQKAFSKTKNNFITKMPDKWLGLFYKKNDIEQALKAVSKSNAKELIALKNYAEEQQQKTSNIKSENLKLAVQNQKLTKYYNNNKSKIEFVNKAFKYNLLEQFKKQIKQKEDIEQAELEKQALLKQQKEQELLQEQLAQQQQIKLTPPTPPNTKYKKGFTLK